MRRRVGRREGGGSVCVHVFWGVYMCVNEVGGDRGGGGKGGRIEGGKERRGGGEYNDKVGIDIHIYR